MQLWQPILAVLMVGIQMVRIAAQVSKIASPENLAPESRKVFIRIVLVSVSNDALDIALQKTYLGPGNSISSD